MKQTTLTVLICMTCFVAMVSLTTWLAPEEKRLRIALSGFAFTMLLLASLVYWKIGADHD